MMDRLILNRIAREDPHHREDLQIELKDRYNRWIFMLVSPRDPNCIITQCFIVACALRFYAFIPLDNQLLHSFQRSSLKVLEKCTHDDPNTFYIRMYIKLSMNFWNFA